jgi:amino-acid racemase
MNMKTIGLIGGMSWESTIPYYRIINEVVRDNLGDLHSAKIILYSVDFYVIEQLQNKGDWEKAGEILASAATKLQSAGADLLVLCTNTMHKIADIIEDKSDIPLLHIVDPTGQEIKRNFIDTVGLIGTRFTMEQDFYRDKLTKSYGINVIIPDTDDREIVHEIIYKELCLGKINTHSRNEYTRIIQNLISDGAQGIIFGCTEISLLINQLNSKVPVFDTTRIHAQHAAMLSINK